MDSRQYDKSRNYALISKFLGRVPLDALPPLFLRMRDELAGCVASIDAMHKEQQAAFVARSHKVEYPIDTLRTHHMQHLARIARPLLRFAPGAEQALRVPHKRTNAAAVAAQALAMAEFLEQHSDVLADANITPEYLRSFRDEATKVATHMARARDARQRGASATRRMAEEIAKAENAVQVTYGLMGLHLGPKHELVLDMKRMLRPPKHVGRPRKIRRRGRRQPPA